MADFQFAFHIEIRLETKLSHLGAFRVMPSSFPVLPTHMEDKYMKPPDSFQLSTVRDLTANPATVQAASSDSNIRSGGNMFSLNDRQYQDSPFISQKLRRDEMIPRLGTSFNQSGEDLSFPPVHSSHSEIHSSTFISNPQEGDDISWGPDPFQDILNLPENDSVQNDQVENSTCYISDDNTKKTAFGVWVEELMSVDDSPNPNWSQLLGDDNVEDSKSKVSFSN